MAMQTVIAHKTCAACGKERKRKNFMYDPATILPYCRNPYICNEDHPNSVHNRIKRAKVEGGGDDELDMVEYEEANELYKKQLLKNHTNAHVAQIGRMLNSATLFRIKDPNMATFLVGFQAEQGFTDMSTTVRQCIQLLMEHKGLYTEKHVQAKQEVVKQEQVAQVVAEVESKPHVVVEDAKETEKASSEWSF